MLYFFKLIQKEGIFQMRLLNLDHCDNRRCSPRACLCSFIWFFGVKNLLSWGSNRQPLENQLDALTTPPQSAPSKSGYFQNEIIEFSSL